MHAVKFQPITERFCSLIRTVPEERYDSGPKVNRRFRLILFPMEDGFKRHILGREVSRRLREADERQFRMQMTEEAADRKPVLGPLP